MQEYGVTIREQDGVLTFLATQEIESGEALSLSQHGTPLVPKQQPASQRAVSTGLMRAPLLISGRTLSEVPA